MDKIILQEFFLKARTETYSSGGGKVKPAFPKMHQLEYKEGDWLYRDIYNMGNGLFMGLETVYFQDNPVLSMSYFGNFSRVTEEEVDKVLRAALMENWDTTRLWNNVKWDLENYSYSCIADGKDINEFSGTEEILKDNQKIYYFYYAGGFIGNVNE